MFDALDLFGASKKVARSIQKFGLKCPSYDILIDSQKHDITRRVLRYTHGNHNSSEIVSRCGRIRFALTYSGLRQSWLHALIDPGL